MLDNALDAASKAEKNREVDITLKISQSFLTVKCENTYSGKLPIGKDGVFHSTKTDPEGHGFGLAQMQRIADKYSGILDIVYTDDRFTIQTALSMRP